MSGGLLCISYSAGGFSLAHKSHDGKDTFARCWVGADAAANSCFSTLMPLCNAADADSHANHALPCSHAFISAVLHIASMAAQDLCTSAIIEQIKGCATLLSTAQYACYAFVAAEYLGSKPFKVAAAEAIRPSVLDSLQHVHASDSLTNKSKLLQALQVLSDDALAEVLRPLPLPLVLRMPVQHISAYLRNHAKQLSAMAELLTAREVCVLAPALHSCKQLTRLELSMRHPDYDSLSKNCISTATGGVELLSCALPAVAQLRHLDLSNCQAFAQGARALANVLHTLPELTTLRFACNLAQAGLTDIVAAASMLPELRELDLCSNAAPCESWQALVAALPRMCLSALRYGAWQCSSQWQQHANIISVAHAPSAASSTLHSDCLVSLQELGLAGTNVEDQAAHPERLHVGDAAASWQAMTVPEWLRCNSLQSLDLLCASQLSVSGAQVLEALCSATMLSMLRLRVEKDHVTSPGLSAARRVQLPRLQHLTLHNGPRRSAVTWHCLHALPAYPSLRSLAVHSRGRYAAQPSDLCSVLLRHSGLQKLEVARSGHSDWPADNEMEHAIKVQVILAAKQLPHLSALHYGGCMSIMDESSVFTAGLRQCTALRDIHLACGVGYEILAAFAHVRQQLRSLTIQSLDTEPAEVGEADMVVTPAEAVSGILGPNLQHLSLGGQVQARRDTVQLSRALFRGLRACTALTHLALHELTPLQHSSAGVDAAAAAVVPSLCASLSGMSTLQSLRLCRLRVANFVASELALCLPRLAQLTALDLSDNRIGSCGIAGIAAALCGMSTLQVLMLQHNSFGSDGTLSLYNAVRHLPRLRRISLSEASRTDPAVAAFRALPRLLELSL